MPFAFASPIHNTAKVFTMLAEKHMYAAQQSSSALVSDDSDAENEHSITFDLPSSLDDTFMQLVSTINHPLFANQPVTSNVPPPKYNPFILSPVQNQLYAKEEKAKRGHREVDFLVESLVF
jgi:hypothetical protein